VTSTTPTLDQPGGDTGSLRPGIISRFGGFLRRHWRWIVPGTAVAIAGLALLAFGYFGVHTLFIDDKVNEDGPVFASGAVADTVDDATPPDSTPPVADTTADTIQGDGQVAPPAEEAPADEVPPAEQAPAQPAEPEIVTLVEGSFIPRSHPGEGVAFVLNDGTEQRFLRFEDFVTDNGPDLNVYLSTAPADASADLFDDDFIDLGTLKGNIGPQNYEIPPDVDLDRYSTVVVWCVRFAVAFTAADLAPAA
jgi:hypothetical protein